MKSMLLPDLTARRTRAAVLMLALLHWLVACRQDSIEAADLRPAKGGSPEPKSARRLEFDLGSALVGDRSVHTLVVPADLLHDRVDEVTGSCAFEVVGLRLRTASALVETEAYEIGAQIPKGGELHVRVRIAPELSGPLDEELRLEAGEDSSILSLRMEAIPLLEFTPPVLDLGTIPLGGQAVGSIIIQSRIIGGLELALDEDPRPGWQVELVQTNIDAAPPETGYRLNVRYTDPHAESRMRSAAVTIRCNSWADVLRPELGLPPGSFSTSAVAKVEVVPSIYATTAHVSFGQMGPGTNVAPVVIRAFDAADLDRLRLDEAALRVSSGLENDPAFELRSNRNGLALECELSIVVPAEAITDQTTVFRGELEIPIDLNAQPVLVLPVVGGLRAAAPLAESSGR